MASVVINDVRKSFGLTPVIHGVDIDITDGEFVVLVGPSGCGKSTLLRMIAGLENITGGEIRIGDRVVNHLPPKARDVAMVFQNYALYPHMTVAANMAFSMKLRGAPKDETDARVKRAAEILGLTELLGRFPRQLSGGQRQRVALARALAIEPRMLLLDEPFGALDAKVRKELRADLRRIHDHAGVTTVFVTHDQEEAMEVSDTIVLMDHGRIVQEGRPQDLYDHPETEFVMRFMGQVNRIGDVYVRPHDVEIRLEPNGTTEAAVVERVLHMGHHIRVDLTVNGGDPVSAQLTRDEAERLGLEPGRPVFVRPAKARTFAGEPEAEAVS